MSIETSKNKGFFIIEALISGVLIIMAFTGSRFFEEFRAEQLLAKTSNQFVHSLSFAKQHALEHEKQVLILFSESEIDRGWKVVSTDRGFNVTAQTLLRAVTLDERITISKVSTHQDIIFKTDGALAQSNPTGEKGLVICNKFGKGQQLKIASSGAITVNKFKGNCL